MSRPAKCACAEEPLVKRCNARENRVMSRFVFFNPHTPFDAKELSAAKKIAEANGATVVRAMVGSLLLEGPPEAMERVAASLLGWRYEPELHYGLPERPSPRGR